MAVSPPVTTAPSSAPTIQVTTGPRPTRARAPDQKKALPKNRPQMPPQKAPSFPQYFIRSPVV